jgi:hypothetical protein
MCASRCQDGGEIGQNGVCGWDGKINFFQIAKREKGEERGRLGYQDLMYLKTSSSELDVTAK